MRLVKVKRKQQEKTIGNLKLVLTLLNVCELSEEDQVTFLDVYQVFNITEVYSCQ